jgi:hypothetical protein
MRTGYGFPARAPPNCLSEAADLHCGLCPGSAPEMEHIRPAGVAVIGPGVGDSVMHLMTTTPQGFEPGQAGAVGLPARDGVHGQAGR